MTSDRNPSDWPHLAEDYAALGSQRAVAERYGCSQSLVSLRMKAAGIGSAYDRHGPRNPKWRGGRHVDKDGYIQVFCPDHPRRTVRNEVPEHRLVMEAALGRYLGPAEIVHHRNGIKDDNRPENLEVIEDAGRHVFERHRHYRDNAGRFYHAQEAADRANARFEARKNAATAKQARVLAMFGAGASRVEIAAALGVTRKDVHYHLTALQQKGLIADRRRPGKAVFPQRIEVTKGPAGSEVRVMA